MNKLWLLLKTQMQSSINSAAADRNKKMSKGFAKRANINKPEIASKKSGSKLGGYIALMTFVFIMFFALAFGFSYLIAVSLNVIGQLFVLPAVMMSAASVMCLITTIYKTNGVLFGFRDYDLVMSLPIKNSTIITSRLMILYSLNFIFTFMIMFPAMIVFFMFTPGLGVLYWLIAIVTMLFVPFVPIIVATIIGSLIAIAASHFKRKSGASTIFTVAALLVWIVFCMNMNSIAENFAAIGGQLVEILNKIYPLTAIYTNALVNQDIVSFLLFLGISIGAFLLFTAIVGKNFKRFNTTITTNRTTSNYKMQELQQQSPRKALFKKEWKRFTSSSIYFINTAIGCIMLIILSVLLLIFGANSISQFLQIPHLMELLGKGAPFVIAFFITISCTTACSISLEGKQLWIVKSIPVHTKDILLSKLRVNMQLLLITIAISATAFAIVLKPGLLVAVMIYVIPLTYAAFVSLLGLKLNLQFPKFDWDTEVKVIKQSIPTMAVVFIGMAVTIVPAILSFLFGDIVLYISIAALIVVDLLLYRNIMTKGVMQFDSMDG